jgi:hypothetical protein
MLATRALKQSLRAPALRTTLSRTPAFPNFVRHNSEKVKGTVVGIGIFTLLVYLLTTIRSWNDKLMCCYYGRKDSSSSGKQ